MLENKRLDLDASKSKVKKSRKELMEQRAVSSHQTPALGTKIKMLLSNQRAYLDTSYVACMMCFQVFIYGWSYFKSLMAMTHPSAQDWFTFFSCQTIEIVFLINPDFWGGGGGGRLQFRSAEMND